MKELYYNSSPRSLFLPISKLKFLLLYIISENLISYTLFSARFILFADTDVIFIYTFPTVLFLLYNYNSTANMPGGQYISFFFSILSYHTRYFPNPKLVFFPICITSPASRAIRSSSGISESCIYPFTPRNAIFLSCVLE